MKKWIKGFVFIGLTSFLVACGNTDNSTEETSSEIKSGQVTVIDSEKKEVTVPVQPKKVVVFDNSALDTMDALGLGEYVIGAATDNMPDYLDQYKTVEYAGGIKEPDLEKINAMQPDLIIISGRQLDYRKQLEAIAPVVYFTVDGERTWDSIKENIKTLATIFEKEKEAEAHLKTLETKITEVKDVAEKSNEKALMVLVNEGNLSAYGEGSRFGILHDTFGFSAADKGIEVSTHGQEVSYEYILKTNPDILFVLDRTKAIGGDTSKNNVADNELVKQTNAAKNGKVISLDPQVWYLSGSGIESLQIMLDDVKAAE